MEKLAVLEQLQDINKDKLQETKNLIQQGGLANMSSQDVIKLANTHFVELNFASGAAIFVNSLDRLKDDAEFLYAFGYFTFECGFLELAEQMLKRAIEISPDTQFRKYFILGEMYKSHEPEVALKLFQKGIELSEKEKNEVNQDLTADTTETERSRKIHSKLTDESRTISQAYCIVAEILMNMPEFPKNKNQILEALKRAEAEDPGYLEPTYQRCFLYFNMEDETRCRKEISKFVEGIKKIEEENDEDLLDYPAVMLVAIVRMMIEGAIWEEGAYLADIATNNNHENYEALYMLAFCSLNIDDLETCKEALDKLDTFDLSKDEEILQGLAELKEEYEEKYKQEENEMEEELPTKTGSKGKAKQSNKTQNDGMQLEDVGEDDEDEWDDDQE